MDSDSRPHPIVIEDSGALLVHLQNIATNLKDLKESVSDTTQRVHNMQNSITQLEGRASTQAKDILDTQTATVALGVKYDTLNRTTLIATGVCIAIGAIMAWIGTVAQDLAKDYVNMRDKVIEERTANQFEIRDLRKDIDRINQALQQSSASKDK